MIPKQQEPIDEPKHDPFPLDVLDFLFESSEPFGPSVQNALVKRDRVLSVQMVMGLDFWARFAVRSRVCQGSCESVPFDGCGRVVPILPIRVRRIIRKLSFRLTPDQHFWKEHTYQPRDTIFSPLLHNKMGIQTHGCEIVLMNDE